MQIEKERYKIFIYRTFTLSCRLLLAAACLFLAGFPARVQAQSAFWTWGYNEFGQLGNGATTDAFAPVMVQGLSGIGAISAGGYHSMALKPDGTVWAWGYNAWGQLGNGMTMDAHLPVAVSGLTHVIAIAGGGYHSLALKADGTVWAWGDNSVGALGDATGVDSLTPVAVMNLTNIAAISTGGEHSLALKADGTVWAWGSNQWGEIGDGTNADALAPVMVGGLTNIVAVSTNGEHNLALKSDGTVWAWGSNQWGELGNGTLTDAHTPIVVPGLAHVVAIAGGRYHSLALKADGTVWAWGYNDDGELGNATGDDSLTPVAVSGLTNVAAISAGGYHSLALKSDGTVWAWGDNTNGELGDGTTDGSLVPMQVMGLAGCTSLVAGNQVSMALSSLSLTLSAASVEGGNPVTATVHLHEPAPPGGAVVTLASDNPAVTLPATVTVQGNALSAAFPVTTNPTIANTAAHLTAAYGGAQAMTPLFISAATVSPALTLTATPASIKGGTGVTGILTLRYAASAALTFILTSADTSAVTIPASVTVPAHATSVTFPISALPVQDDVSVTIAAHFGTNVPTVTASLTVLAPALADLSLSPATVTDGGSSVGTITLDSVAPSGGYAVHVASSNFRLVRPPMIVTVPAGSSSQIFTIVTRAMPVTTTVRINAGTHGVTKTATLTLQPLLQSLSVAPASVKGGVSTWGTITLNAAAPTGGTIIALTSNSTAASAPASVRVMAGATSATFPIGTHSVNTMRNAILTATVGRVARRVTLRLTP